MLLVYLIGKVLNSEIVLLLERTDARVNHLLKVDLFLTNQGFQASLLLLPVFITGGLLVEVSLHNLNVISWTTFNLQIGISIQC